MSTPKHIVSTGTAAEVVPVYDLTNPDNHITDEAWRRGRDAYFKDTPVIQPHDIREDLVVAEHLITAARERGIVVTLGDLGFANTIQFESIEAPEPFIIDLPLEAKRPKPPQPRIA